MKGDAQTMIDLRQQYRKSLSVLILLTSIFVGACAGLGIPTPQNTEQSIAYMYPAIGTVADETSKLLKAKKIKTGEAQMVLNILENTRSATNIARDYLRDGDEPRAKANLNLARNVFKEAQDFINRYKGEQ